MQAFDFGHCTRYRWHLALGVLFQCDWQPWAEASAAPTANRGC